jgi:hypothetical protein
MLLILIILVLRVRRLFLIFFLFFLFFREGLEIFGLVSEFGMPLRLRAL